MFDLMFESLRKATDVTLQMQREFFKQWVGFVPAGVTPPTAWGDQAQKFQKKWAETVTDMVKKQNEVFEAQFKAGLQNIEEAFRVADVKDIEDLRAKCVQLWRKSFECLRQAFESQLREFQAATGKWAEFVTKGAA